MFCRKESEVQNRQVAAQVKPLINYRIRIGCGPSASKLLFLTLSSIHQVLAFPYCSLSLDLAPLGPSGVRQSGSFP